MSATRKAPDVRYRRSGEITGVNRPFPRCGVLCANLIPLFEYGPS